MSGFNLLILMGNLTRDPQTRHLQSGTSVTEFGIAVNRRWKSAQGEDREEVTFTDCKAWGKIGETIAQYLQKGNPVLLSGRLAQEKWEDKQTGQPRSKHVMVVESFTFVGAKRDGQEQPSAPPQSEGPEIGGVERPRSTQPDGNSSRRYAASMDRPRQQPVTAEQAIGPDHFSEDDIPF